MSQLPLVETQRWLITTTEPGPRRKTFQALDGFERGHATAVSSSIAAEPAPYQLRPFDASSTIRVAEEFPTEEKKKRTNQSAIPGELDELLCLFDACLNVGRLDRAALVLKRTDVLNAMGQTAVMHLHNNYLAARVAQLEMEPSETVAEGVHRWFERNIAQSLTYTAETIGYMLKVSLLTSSERQKHIRVQRYMGLLSMEGNMEYLGDVLSPQDLATISEICPEYSMPEDVSTLRGAEEDVESTGSADLESYSDSMFKGEEGVPQVLATEQRGAGLRTIKSAITLLNKMREGFDVASLPLAERREIQTILEKDSVEAAISRWREETEALSNMGLSTAFGNASLNSKIYDWHQALEAHITADLKKVGASEAAKEKSPEDQSRCVYGPLMLQCAPSRLAAIAILSAINSLSYAGGTERGTPVSALVNDIAKHVEEDIIIQHMVRQNKHTKQYTQKVAKSIRRRQSISQFRETQESARSGTDPTGGVFEAPHALAYVSWPQAVRVKIGATLLAALIDTAKITVVREHPETAQLVSQVQAAFIHSIRLQRGKKIGVITSNKAVAELLQSEPPTASLARHMPMIVQPEPWTRWDKGGYLAYPTPILRIKNGDREQRIYAEAALSRGDMKQMQLGLDILGRTAWKINRNVFNVQLEVWNTGEGLASIPPLNPKFDVPEEPESTADPMKRRLWIKQVKAAENERMGLHSERCFMNFQLEVARAYRDQTFYFPHNLDFRGRAYPIPTYLNHMGADHMRGLLMFAEGRKLGQNGLRWLKIQLSNVYGFDKASFPEREEFANLNRENIIDSARNPLGGKRWWLKAEDPWQCLAACFELKAAWDLPDPTKFVTHLPVHQDGTCNGLQHYAALGGDTWGARQVNLIPGERPADVYGAVAEIVAQKIDEGAVHNTNPYAKVLQGKINRKIVKPSVMTNVYGVTFIGAKAQVEKQLLSQYPDLVKETGVELNMVAGYVATLIFEALATMFSGAHNIQTWLGEIGGRVCRALTYEQIKRIEKKKAEHDANEAKVYKYAINKAFAMKNSRTDLEQIKEQFRSTIVWTTPLRMPVVQPYRTNTSKVIPTSIQDLILEDRKRTDPVHRRKQLQGFPPNFIHSLDASHMILSALQCNERGINFAAVHDSFWTHACDVDTMNTVLRDSFIRIHSEDVIGRLKAEFEARHRGSIYLAKLKWDTPVAKEIHKLRLEKYAGRFHATTELLEEKRRQDLLKSEDPKEVEEGKAMVTGASIFETLQAQDALLAAAEALETPDKDDEKLVATADADETVEPLKEAEAIAAEVEEQADGLKDAEGRPAEDQAYGGKYATGSDAHFFKDALAGRKKPATKPQQRTIMVWLPLTFPDIPKKGDFNVSQLKSSKYFFS